jgi:phosphoribosyl-ATP pyrophosphohydrolase
MRTGSARTAKMLSGGRAKIAQKVIEEAAEVGIDGVRGDGSAVIRKSADLLYNILAFEHARTSRT